MTATTNQIEVIISSRQSNPQALREAWQYRELLWALTWRNIHVRYKQAAIGILWVLLRPLMMVAMYTAIFGMVAKLPSINGVPYSIMVLSGLVIWVYVSQTVSSCSASFFADAPIITKVYFPRLFVPLSNVLSGLTDFIVTFAFLFGLMIWKSVPFTAYFFAIVLVFFFMTFFALGLGLLLGALTIKYRDVQHITPFILQLGFYATPVVYNSEIVPAQYKWIYFLNPLAGIVDGFRWCLLGQPVEFLHLVESASVCAGIFVLAILAFRTVEPVMIDQM